MTTAIHSLPSADSPAPVARFVAALAASALAHWVLLSAPPADLGWRRATPGPNGVPITVRLTPAPVPVPDVPERQKAREKWGQEKRGQARFTASASQGQKIEPGPFFQAPDPNYYPARELDEYPRPLVPLRVDRPAGAGGGAVRLEVLIDERGVVREAVFAGSGGPGSAEEVLRAALTATPFLPARKDGRAVKSRLLMSISFEAGD
jgi:protein TonB